MVNITAAFYIITLVILHLRVWILVSLLNSKCSEHQLKSRPSSGIYACRYEKVKLSAMNAIDRYKLLSVFSTNSLFSNIVTKGTLSYLHSLYKSQSCPWCVMHTLAYESVKTMIDALSKRFISLPIYVSLKN